MQINIKATNMELTDAIRDYVFEKVGYLEKFLNVDCAAFVEVGKNSNHHNKGEDIYLAEVNIKSKDGDYFNRQYAGDLYAAVDLVKEELQRDISKNKDRRQTLFVRGARSIKKRIKGLKPWWPFGGKNS